MDLNYGGFVPISTVDWSEKSTVVVFFAGCPFNCGYCHNHQILDIKNIVDTSKIEKLICDSKDYVSGVVFSGGEPLMQPAIIPLAEYAKKIGLDVGIHTNGYNPYRAELLVSKNLVDKFFIDIKAPFNYPYKYSKVADIPTIVAPQTIQNISRTIMLASKLDEIELRTTVFDGVVGHRVDIALIASWIRDNVRGSNVTYVVQQGIPEKCLSEELRFARMLGRDEVKDLALIAKKILPDVRIRTTYAGEEKL